METNKRNWKAIALADLHCGCPRLDPFRFQACIEKYVLPKITSDITHLFICGDFFDLLINMNSVASTVALTVISELKQACATTGTKLRVLRGTFTHDRNQPRHFIVTSPQYNEIVKLYDTLSIEYDEETNMYFLYMPDNLPYADIEGEVEKLLASHAIEKVDVVIHHGYFKHMLPPGIPEPSGTLDYDKFKKFYSGCVLNGHVHVHSVYNNVVSVGSFDRMAYGEEEDKGFYIVSKSENRYTFEFVKNEDANPFWTINLNRFGEDTASAVDYIMNEWSARLTQKEDDNRAIHVRLISDNPAVLEGCRSLLVNKFNRITVDKGASTKREQLISNLNLELCELQEITVENLGELLLPIIQKQHPGVSDKEILEVLEELKGGKK